MPSASTRPPKTAVNRVDLRRQKATTIEPLISHKKKRLNRKIETCTFVYLLVNNDVAQLAAPNQPVKYKKEKICEFLCVYEKCHIDAHTYTHLYAIKPTITTSLS